MIVKLLTEHHLEFLSLKGGCRGLSESKHVKIPHCWKSHALAQFNETNTFALHKQWKPVVPFTIIIIELDEVPVMIIR